MNKRSGTIIVFLMIAIITLYTFWGLWNTYFQQDEWNGFGKVIYAQHFGYMSLVRLYGSHFTPLSSLFFAFLYNLFGFDARGYAWYSLILHIVNGTLVYVLALKISKRVDVGLLAAFWFISAYISRQAVLWFAASPSFLPATFFSLLALIGFEEYLMSSRQKYLFYTILCIFLGLGFRENVIFLFPYVLARAYLIRRPLFRKAAMSTFVAAFVYCGIRFFPRGGNAGGTLRNVIMQATEFTFVSLPQLMISRDIAVDLGSWIIGLNIPLVRQFVTSTNVPLFIETVFIRMFYNGLWVGMAVFIYLFISRFVHVRRDKLNIFSIVVYLLLSVLPFSFLPRSVYMESRHFYLSAVGFSLLAGYVFYYFIRSSHLYSRVLFCCLFLFIIGTNMMLIRKAIHDAIKISTIRKSLVSQLTHLYPIIPPKTVFYAEGKVLPFQSGDGYTLMVLYHDRQPYYSFLKEDVLWNLGSQGYKENNNVGFGYFREFDRLLETYCKENLAPKNVLSFLWNEEDEKLYDTTELTRQKLNCSI